MATTLKPQDLELKKMVLKEMKSLHIDIKLLIADESKDAFFADLCNTITQHNPLYVKMHMTE